MVIDYSMDEEEEEEEEDGDSYVKC